MVLPSITRASLDEFVTLSQEESRLAPAITATRLRTRVIEECLNWNMSFDSLKKNKPPAGQAVKVFEQYGMSLKQGINGCVSHGVPSSLVWPVRFFSAPRSRLPPRRPVAARR